MAAEEDHPAVDQVEEECLEEAPHLQEVLQWHHQDLLLDLPLNNTLSLRDKDSSEVVGV